MTIFQSIILALVQGITEFLPISSSGHLVLFQNIFNISQPPVLFDVLLHLGTLGAIIIFLKKEIWFLIKKWRSNLRIWKLLIIGTIPAAIFGYWLNNLIEEIVSSLKLVGLMWLVMGLMLVLTKKLKREEEKKKLVEIKWTDAMFIGLFQAFALFPGISRSGATIIGGLWRKLSAKTAFNFSFLLAIPAILGAVGLQLVKNGADGVTLANGILPMIVAGLVGYFSLKFLQKTLASQKIYLFGYYCLALGIMAMII